MTNDVLQLHPLSFKSSHQKAAGTRRRRFISIMEGVGARFGRSSTRYGGPATVFTGPVRKWKKKWVHVPPPNSNHHHHAASNGTANGSNGSSHLQLYKWTPIAPSQSKDGSNNDNNGADNGNAEPKNSSKDDDVVVEEPPKRRFKYIPVIFAFI